MADNKKNDISNLTSNIEIKAKLDNFQKVKTIAEGLSSEPCQVLYQEDVFFISPNGRLKLRIFDSHNGELIFYDRDETKIPKKSFYVISKTQDPESLKLALSLSMKIRGTVKKKRLVYLVGQTRIHLDEVEGLGNFLELEFVRKLNQPSEDGIKEVQSIMSQIEITENDLINGAYIDLLESKKKSLAAKSGY